MLDLTCYITSPEALLMIIKSLPHLQKIIINCQFVDDKAFAELLQYLPDIHSINIQNAFVDFCMQNCASKIPPLKSLILKPYALNYDEIVQLMVKSEDILEEL